MQTRALKVLDLILLVNLIVSLTSGTAGHVIPHAVISPLFLHSRDVGRCREVKEETEKALDHSRGAKTLLKLERHSANSCTFSPPEGVL